LDPSFPELPLWIGTLAVDSISCSTRGHWERSSRIDTDNFQYEGVLSKIERVGLGEKVDAGEEEK
jgi:hypothetical protein